MNKYNVKEVFAKYKTNNELVTADIIHMYDTGIECAKEGTGYNDARHFKAVIYNTNTLEKKELHEHHDIVDTADAKVYSVKIFADGSTLVSLVNVCVIGNGQCIFVAELGDKT